MRKSRFSEIADRRDLEGRASPGFGSRRSGTRDQPEHVLRMETEVRAFREFEAPPVIAALNARVGRHPRIGFLKCVDRIRRGVFRWNHKRCTACTRLWG
jgi:hypothetical protein